MAAYSSGTLSGTRVRPTACATVYSAHPVTSGPSLASVPDASWALRYHRPLRRKGPVDEAEIGMADPAERDLDEHFAGPGSGIGISSTAMILESA